MMAGHRYHVQPMKIFLLALWFVMATPTSSPSTAPAMESLSVEGVTLRYPNTWTARELSQLGGTLIVCRDPDAPWQANIFVEMRSGQKSRPLSEDLAAEQKLLAESKHNFKLTSQQVTKHPAGFEYGIIRYTCDDRAGTTLSERAVIVPIGADKRFCIVMSAATNELKIYEPIFDEVLKSVRMPKQ
jgi:hypothetical protein